MGTDVKKMLKSVLICDIIVAVIAAIIFYFVFKDYDLIIILGLFISSINFIMNAYFSSYAMAAKKSQMFIVLGSIIRIGVACAIAVLLYKYNTRYPIAFLGGYTLHYAAVVLYGLTIKNERK